jgi:hypothetical protein
LHHAHIGAERNRRISLLYFRECWTCDSGPLGNDFSGVPASQSRQLQLVAKPREQPPHPGYQQMTRVCHNVNNIIQKQHILQNIFYIIQLPIAGRFLPASAAAPAGLAAVAVPADGSALR